MGIESKLRDTPLHKPYLCLRNSKFGRLVLLFIDPTFWLTWLRRIRDSFHFLNEPSANRALYRQLLKHLKEQNKNWPHLKYSYGYFYQGWDRIGISGNRPTEVRFEQYNLKALLDHDMEVLDVGSNAGFMSLCVAGYVRHVDAVEFNPYQVAIGRDVAAYLGVHNVTFYNCDFLQFQPAKQYDLIMSFANHHTDDENMRPLLWEYFQRLHGMVKPGGILMFESHTNDIHSADFHATMEQLDDLFTLVAKRFLVNGKNRGGDRLFYVLQKA